MDSILEQDRLAHEEIERLENLAAQIKMDAVRGHKERLAQELRISRLVDTVVDKSRRLLELYEDKDGVRKAEIDKLAGGNEFSEFYARLKDLKDYHRRYPNVAVEPMELAFMSADQDRDNNELLERLFSGEEAYGRFLDLHTAHEQYLNLANVRKLNYLAYIDHFDKVQDIPLEAKGLEYKSYLSVLATYFEGFISRAMPLYDLPQLRQAASDDFERLWSQNFWPGWETAQEDQGDPALFCDICQKQFMRTSVFDAHLKEKKHKKAKEKLDKIGKQPTQEETNTARLAKARELNEKRKEVAHLEALVRAYSDFLREYIEATKENVERRQTLTESELKDEMEGDTVDVDGENDESDDENRIYNPLKLPLGWDGKPIPYWLYKLHGLGIEYPCEICGNYVYMGRKAFERHFQEWRHAHGMRCLGIPNSRHFSEITLIEDAYALWEKLKSSTNKEQFRPEIEEEFEDADGNVFNRKTYEDLTRQGLL